MLVSSSTPNLRTQSLGQPAQSLTSPEAALAALRGIPTRSNYSSKVDDHVAMLNRISSQMKILPADQQQAIKAAISRHYEDYPYLGSQVTAKLSTNQKEAVLGHTRVIQFKQSEFAASAYASVNLQISLSEDPTPLTTFRSFDSKPPSSGSSQPVPRQFRPRPTESLSPKEAYLHGIRNASMLGDHELQPLANIIGVPIVVIRPNEFGQNCVEVIAYPEQGVHDIDEAVFVQNLGNAHFKAFTPRDVPVDLKGGDIVSGSAIEAGGSGNNCLLLSLEKSGAAFGGLNFQEIRNRIADFQQVFYDTEVYIPDRGSHTASKAFKSFAEIPSGFTGHVTVTSSEDEYSQGYYRNNGPVGDWTLRTLEGLYTVRYDDEHTVSSVIQNRRNVNGIMEACPDAEVDRSTLQGVLFH